MGDKIGIMGAGALGSYVGAFLARAGEDIAFVDMWPEHVEKMQKHRFLPVVDIFCTFWTQNWCVERYQRQVQMCKKCQHQVENGRKSIFQNRCRISFWWLKIGFRTMLAKNINEVYKNMWENRENQPWINIYKWYNTNKTKLIYKVDGYVIVPLLNLTIE